MSAAYSAPMNITCPCCRKCYEFFDTHKEGVQGSSSKLGIIYHATKDVGAEFFVENDAGNTIISVTYDYGKNIKKTWNVFISIADCFIMEQYFSDPFMLECGILPPKYLICLKLFELTF